jgi:hypothetical protein
MRLITGSAAGLSIKHATGPKRGYTLVINYFFLKKTLSRIAFMHFDGSRSLENATRGSSSMTFLSSQRATEGLRLTSSDRDAGERADGVHGRLI